MADTTLCFLEDVKCDDCDKPPVNYVHWGPLTNSQKKKLCAACMRRRNIIVNDRKIKNMRNSAFKAHAHHFYPSLNIETCDAFVHETNFKAGWQAAILHFDLIQAALKKKEKAEGVCEHCQNFYAVWFTDNEIWNKYHKDYNFLCPTCFIFLAEQQGCQTTGWHLTLEESNL